jgi:hypothetical protein
MKTLKRFLSFIAGICLLLSCSKSSDQLNPGLSGLSADNHEGYGFGCGEVFVVKPNGNDDTEPLKQAFEDAIKAGPGSVVKLVKGNYKVGFIELREFYGSFVGEGKGKTIITAKAGLDCEAANDLYEIPCIIKFVGGDIKMNNMTLQTPSEAICSSGDDLYGFVLFSDYNAQFEPENCYIKAVVNNVEFIGHPSAYVNSLYGYNCNFALQAMQDDWRDSWKRSNIDMTVTNCTFNTFGFGTIMSYIKEGKLVVGTENNGNVYTNCLEAAGFWDDINVKISVTDNTFNIPGLSYGLDIDNAPEGPESQTKSLLCTIEENEFNDKGGSVAVWLHDHQYALHPQDNIPMLISMKNNRINMSDGADCGIYMLELQNAIFRNNKFTGTGNDGMYAICKWSDIISKNGFILGNNFSHTTFSDAAIYLDYTTKNWTVIGNANATLINLGVDNIIKNVNFNHGHDNSGKDKQRMENHNNFNHGNSRGHHHN